MAASKPIRIGGWVLAVILGGMFFVAGLGKVTGSATEMFAGWGYAPWFAIFIGVCELAGGLGLIIPKTTRLAVLGLTLIMLGAVYTHIANSQMPEVVRPLVFLAALWGLWWLRKRTPSES